MHFLYQMFSIFRSNEEVNALTVKTFSIVLMTERIFDIISNL